MPVMAPFPQLSEERCLRLLLGNSTGPSQVSSSEYVSKVDDHQQYEEERIRC